MFGSVRKVIFLVFLLISLVYAKYGYINLCKQGTVYLKSVDKDGWEINCPGKYTVMCIGTNQGKRVLRMDKERGFWRLFMHSGGKITKAFLGRYNNIADATARFLAMQAGSYRCVIDGPQQYCWVSASGSNCWTCPTGHC